MYICMYVFSVEHFDVDIHAIEFKVVDRQIVDIFKNDMLQMCQSAEIRNANFLSIVMTLPNRPPER
jgi:hypothetical protein